MISFILLLLNAHLTKGNSAGHDRALKYIKCYDSYNVEKYYDGYRSNSEPGENEQNIKHCMGHACSRIEGSLWNNVVKRNTTYDIRACDGLKQPGGHSLSHRSSKDHKLVKEVYCNIDRAFAAFLYMFEAMHEKCGEECKIYPAKEGKLFMTDDECLQLEPYHFPQFKDMDKVLSGKITFCCCSKRLCNSSNPVVSIKLWLLVTVLILDIIYSILS